MSTLRKNIGQPASCLVLLLCFFLIACSESPEEIYQRLDNQAEHFLSKKKYPQALAAWDNLITLQPNSPPIYKKIGETCLTTAQYHKALQAFSQHLNLQPAALESWLAVAKIHLILGDIYAAEQGLAKSGKFKDTAEGLILHGDLLSAQRKFSSAEDAYRKVVAQNPQNQTGLARLALLLLGQNKTTEAEKLFASLSALKPKSPDILLQMGNFCLLSGNSPKASNYFNQAVSQTPDDLSLHIRLAMFHANHKQYEQAIAVLETLHETFPDNRFTKKILIETLLLNRQLDEAGEILNGLAGTEENDLDFRMLKGKYYMNTFEIHAAVSQFLAVVEKEPKLPLGHYLLSLAYLAGGQDMLGQKSLIKCLTLNPDFTEAELTLANIYYKNKSYDLALEHVTRITKREPENFRAHLIAGNILLAQNEYQAAIGEYQAAQLLNPELTAPAYYSVTATFHTGDTEKALRLSRIFLESQPEFTDAFLQYTHLLVKQDRVSEAIEFLKEFTDQLSTTNTPYLYSILAMLLQQMDRPTEASSNFHKALSTNPAMRSAYMHLFDLHADDHQKLEKLLTSAISNISSFNEAYVRLAALYCDTHQPQKAIALLEEALSADPESPQLANNLAWLYVEYQPEDIDEAMRLAQKAYEKLPNNPATADTLGWVYYKKNMLTRASWLLEQALKLDPENPQIKAHLATAQQQ